MTDREVIDAPLMEMIRVMAGLRPSLERAAADVGRVRHTASRLGGEVGYIPIMPAIAEARALLNQAIATLMVVRDNLQRAEANIKEIRR